MFQRIGPVKPQPQETHKVRTRFSSSDKYISLTADAESTIREQSGNDTFTQIVFGCGEKKL